MLPDEKGLFPGENNARFNGSSYVSLIVDNIEKLNAVPIQLLIFDKYLAKIAK